MRELRETSAGQENYIILFTVFFYVLFLKVQVILKVDTHSPASLKPLDCITQTTPLPVSNASAMHAFTLAPSSQTN